MSGAPDEVLVSVGHAHGDDVRLEGHRFVEPEQGEVVLERPVVEVGEGDHYLDPPLLVQVGLRLRGEIVFTQAEQKVA